MIRRAILALCCGALSIGIAAHAAVLTVESEAAIENEDISLARQLALRRAMTLAAEQAGGWLHATTESTLHGVQERTALTSKNRIVGARLVNETIENGQLKLVAEVELEAPGGPTVCQGLPRRKVAVMAFPLQFPEQVPPGGYTVWPQTTADLLARQIDLSGHLLAASAASQTAFESAGRAPAPQRKDGLPRLTETARAARAQYVLAGVIRDFGLQKKYLVVPEQQIKIEAFIYDGFSGELLARRMFVRDQVNFSSPPASARPETEAFQRSRFGQMYLDLLGELARWTENTVGCLPFAARVLHTDKSALYLDVGSDSGLEPGMEFMLTRESAEGTTTADGLRLGHEREALAGVVIKRVAPRHSVGEITARKSPPAAKPGDVVFGH